MFTPRKSISEQIGMMFIFSHIRYIGKNPLWCNIVLGFVNLMLLVVLPLLLIMVMAEVVWFLGPPKLPT